MIYFLLNADVDNAQSNNMNELNKLLDDGWIPIREEGFNRYVLILLYKEVQ